MQTALRVEGLWKELGLGPFLDRDRTSEAATMAGALSRRAATAVAAGCFPTGRRLASTTTPRFPAAATAATSLPHAVAKPSARRFASIAGHRLSSAAAAKSFIGRPPATPTAKATFPTLRRSHHGAAVTPEQLQALDGRIKSLEVDVENKIVTLREQLKKESMERYEKCLQGQASNLSAMTELNKLVVDESHRSIERAANSSLEHANAVIEVGKVSWRVVVTVVAAAATTGFGVAQLLRVNSSAEQANVADRIVSTKTAEMQEMFTSQLESTVQRAVEVALAKEARRKVSSDEEALKAINARLEDVFTTLDERISRAVGLALAKQAEKNKADAKGGGPRA